MLHRSLDHDDTGLSVWKGHFFYPLREGFGGQGEAEKQREKQKEKEKQQNPHGSFSSHIAL
jgi:hypothetical protein